MDNGKIEAIIFDLGNVLIDFDHMIAARRIAHFSNKSGEEIYALFFNSEITTLFEAGKVSPEEFFLEVKKMLNLKIDYQTFLPIWNEIFFFSAKNRAVFRIASHLKDRYKTAVLSNVNFLHFEYLKKSFPVFKIFHHVFTSFELGLAKPEQAIYQKALSFLGTCPERTFYVDDRKELVESAQTLGIKGFLFTSPHQLKHDLFVSGIEV
ncbi:MAG: HAD family phosphatase [Candidatus Omnitrophica bacterium]|nr:HAD family phosphatase [Candidatus Omnitrophota bacterium]